MKNVISKPEPSHPAIESNSHLFDDWFDPIENMIRGQVRGLIEEMIRGELDATLSRPRYGRRAGHSEGRDLTTAVVTGHRHGSRVRTLMGTFGKTDIAVPRARLNISGGKTTEWKSRVLRNYQRRTRAADALIAGAYLAGTNTRRVRRALRSVFGGEVGKDTVSRVWRKVKGDWDAWNSRSLAKEPIVRLISTAPWCACGSTAKPLLSHCSLSSGYARTVKKCSWRSNKWAARAPRPGARSSTISSGAACSGPSSSSSMAARGSRARSPPFGIACRCRGAPCISIVISLPTPRSACMRRSPRTTTK